MIQTPHYIYWSFWIAFLFLFVGFGGAVVYLLTSIADSLCDMTESMEGNDPLMRAAEESMDQANKRLRENYDEITLLRKKIQCLSGVVRSGLRLYRSKACPPHDKDGPYKLMANDPECGPWINAMDKTLQYADEETVASDKASHAIARADQLFSE